MSTFTFTPVLSIEEALHLDVWGDYYFFLDSSVPEPALLATALRSRGMKVIFEHQLNNGPFRLPSTATLFWFSDSVDCTAVGHPASSQLAARVSKAHSVHSKVPISGLSFLVNICEAQQTIIASQGIQRTARLPLSNEQMAVTLPGAAWEDYETTMKRYRFADSDPGLACQPWLLPPNLPHPRPVIDTSLPSLPAAPRPGIRTLPQRALAPAPVLQPVVQSRKETPLEAARRMVMERSVAAKAPVKVVEQTSGAVRDDGDVSRTVQGQSGLGQAGSDATQSEIEVIIEEPAAMEVEQQVIEPTDNALDDLIKSFSSLTMGPIAPMSLTTLIARRGWGTAAQPVTPPHRTSVTSSTFFTPELTMDEGDDSSDDFQMMSPRSLNWGEDEEGMDAVVELVDTMEVDMEWGMEMGKEITGEDSMMEEERPVFGIYRPIPPPQIFGPWQCQAVSMAYMIAIPVQWPVYPTPIITIQPATPMPMPNSNQSTHSYQSVNPTYLKPTYVPQPMAKRSAGDAELIDTMGDEHQVAAEVWVQPTEESMINDELWGASMPSTKRKAPVRASRAEQMEVETPAQQKYNPYAKYLASAPGNNGQRKRFGGRYKR